MSAVQNDRRQSGIVAAALTRLIARQVDARGLVVWFDPTREYIDLLPALDLKEAGLVRYDGSFFRLRREIEPLLGGERPPRLVVYVPLDQAATEDALIEATAAGVTIYPGAES